METRGVIELQGDIKKSYSVWHSILIIIYVICTICLFLITENCLNLILLFAAFLRWIYKCDSKGSDGVVRRFNHPDVLIIAFILSELLCGLLYLIITFCYHIQKIERLCTSSTNRTGSHLLTAGNVQFSPVKFMIPAVLQIFSTLILVFVEYINIYHSLDVMMGFKIMFTVLFSMVLLNRSFRCRHWWGIVITMVSLVVGGFSCMVTTSNIEPSTAQNDILSTGVHLIHFLFRGLIRVIEEKYMVKYDAPPLLAAGYKGLFGLVIAPAFLAATPFIEVGREYVNNSGGTLTDPRDMLDKIQNKPIMCLPIALLVVLLPLFIIASFHIKKELSSVKLVMLTPVHVFLSWWIFLGVGWRKYNAYQVASYAVSLLGSFLYYDVLFCPVYHCLSQCVTRRLWGSSLWRGLSRHNVNAPFSGDRSTETKQDKESSVL